MKWLPAALPIGFEGIFANIWPSRPAEDPPPPVVQTLGSAREADCIRDGGKSNIFGETAQVRREPDFSNYGLDSMPIYLVIPTLVAFLARQAPRQTTRFENAGDKI